MGFGAIAGFAPRRGGIAAEAGRVGYSWDLARHVRRSRAMRGPSKRDKPKGVWGVRESELRRVRRPGRAHCSTTDVEREVERAASASVRI